MAKQKTKTGNNALLSADGAAVKEAGSYVRTDKHKDMPNFQKVESISRTPEIMNAIKLLYALYQDCKLNSHIQYLFKIEGKDFQLIFQETKSLCK